MFIKNKFPWMNRLSVINFLNTLCRSDMSVIYIVKWQSVKYEIKASVNNQ